MISRARLPKRFLVLGGLVAGLTLATTTGTAHAGAWTLPKGSGQVILTNLYYWAQDEFSKSGNRHGFSNDGEFTKYEFNPYIEYGLRDDLTLVLNTFVRRVSFTNEFSGEVNFGLADPELALRYRLSPPDAQTIWAVQAALKFPVAVPHDTPPLGNEQTDAEARLLVGRGFNIFGRWAYWDVEVAYRFRDEAPADEIKLDLTLGVSLTDDWLVIGQFFATRGLRNGETIQVQGNPTLDTNYDLYKAQLSVVYQLTKSTRIQVGYQRDLAGRNTGAGQATLLSLWFRF